MSDIHRYLFTVRQQFNSVPKTDCFYRLTVPSELTESQAKIMGVLSEGWMQAEIKNDVCALKGMQVRVRHNSDMYIHVCMVRTSCEIDADTLDSIIADKYANGKLQQFLKDAQI